MPPKGSKKAKPEPDTPSVKPDGKMESDGEVLDTPTRPKATPRRRKTVTPQKFNPLTRGSGDVAPVDVGFDNDTVHCKPLPSPTGGFIQGLQLKASQPFKLVETVMLTTGAHAGSQAIIIQPSKPLPFIELENPLRLKIYQYYFASSGKVYGKIDITQNARGLIAKAYVAEAKNRLALLRVNKEIGAQALGWLYSLTFRFDKTETLLTFLSCAGPTVRERIAGIELAMYNKATAIPVMTMLAECKNIQRLFIGDGLGKNTTPSKTAKSFFTDAHRFLEVIGQVRGSKTAGMHLLIFGKRCFTVKEDGDMRNWTDQEMEEFEDELKAKLILYAPNPWPCICGSKILYHVCATVMGTRFLANFGSLADDAALSDDGSHSDDAALSDDGYISDSVSLVDGYLPYDSASASDCSSLYDSASDSASLLGDTIDDYASALDEGSILDDASVLNDASVSDDGSLADDVSHSDSASLIDWASLYDFDDASLPDSASFRDPSSVLDDATLYDDAPLDDDALDDDISVLTPSLPFTRFALSTPIKRKKFAMPVDSPMDA